MTSAVRTKAANFSDMANKFTVTFFSMFLLTVGIQVTCAQTNHRDADKFFKKAILESKELPTQDQALKDYAAAIALNPNNPDYYVGQAHLLFDLEEDEAALVSASKAIKLDAKCSDAWRVKARVEGRLKRPADGLASLKVAMKLLPLSAQLLEERGRLYRLAGRYEEAEKDLDQAIVMNPRLQSAYIERVLVTTKLKKWNKVIADCNIGLKTDAMHHDHVLQQRAEAKIGLNDYAGAKADLNEALKHSPDNIKIHQALTAVYQKLGDSRGLALEAEKIKLLNRDFR